MAKYAVSTKAVKLLRKVQKHILEDPRRFDMAEIGERLTEKERKERGIPKQRMAPCGTTACIAGWTSIIALGNKLKWEDGGDGRLIPNCDLLYRAAELLKLDDDQSEALFYDKNWPDAFRIQYQIESIRPGLAAKKKAAKVAADRIEHFMLTGE